MESFACISIRYQIREKTLKSGNLVSQVSILPPAWSSTASWQAAALNDATINLCTLASSTWMCSVAFCLAQLTLLAAELDGRLLHKPVTGLLHDDQSSVTKEHPR